MIIDLCDFLKDKPHIYVSDYSINYGNSIRFVDDNVTGFLFNIEVGDKFIIELFKNPNRVKYYGYHIIIWDHENDSSIYEKDNITGSLIKEELINCITYCEKYLNLIVFS